MGALRIQPCRCMPCISPRGWAYQMLNQLSSLLNNERLANDFQVVNSVT